MREGTLKHASVKKDPFVVIDKPHYQVTEIGLDAKEPLTFEEWEFLGLYLTKFSKGVQWALGDWLYYGENRSDWEHVYSQALNSTDFDEQTLRNYRWVAGKIPRNRRRVELTWTHHAMVAPLPPAKQDYWLEKSVVSNWTSRQLRQAVSGLSVEDTFPNPSLKSNGLARREQRQEDLEDGKIYSLADVKIFFMRLDEEAKKQFKQWVNEKF